MRGRSILGIRKKSRDLSLAIALMTSALSIFATPAHAAALLVETDWVPNVLYESFRGPLVSKAHFSTDGVTGIGTEDFFVHLFTLTGPDIGAYTAQFSFPLDHTPGHMFARYENGVLQSFNDVGVVVMKNDFSNHTFSMSYGTRRYPNPPVLGELILKRGFSTFGEWDPLSSSVVPLPGTLLLLASGLFAFRRSSNQSQITIQRASMLHRWGASGGVDGSSNALWKLWSKAKACAPITSCTIYAHSRW